uniref:Uncharacterized protein n=1 Tax=Myotis myotis TaxID=51298 RepID=A0A7J7ZXD1_MYOMY|nr:hypothetical protein mMyoMyo1_009730 [Myotis myotis]
MQKPLPQPGWGGVSRNQRAEKAAMAEPQPCPKESRVPVSRQRLQAPLRESRSQARPLPDSPVFPRMSPGSPETSRNRISEPSGACVSLRIQKDSRVLRCQTLSARASPLPLHATSAAPPRSQCAFLSF